MILRTQEEIIKDWPENSEPLVSISCITYNQEPYISRPLDGFLMQKTDFPFEILIHDDASTDKTADIIREKEVKDISIFPAPNNIENNRVVITMKS